MTRKSWICSLVAVGTVLGLAACGSSSSKPKTTAGTAILSAADSPSSVIPADAVLYVQGEVRPSGALADGINAGAKKLVGIADPGAMLDRAIDSAIKTPGVSYESTIRPWLGEQAAVALLPAVDQKPQYAVVADTTDAATARTTVFGLVRDNAKTTGATVTSATYKGVGYLADGSAAVAVDGNFVLVGTLDAVEKVIDVQQGAPALSAAPDFQASTAHELAGAVLDAFVRTRALVDMFVLAATAGGGSASASSAIPLAGSAIASRVPASAMALLDKLIPADSTILASARLNASGLTVDLAMPTGGAAGAGASDLFASMPAGSWLVLAESGIGAQLGKLAALVTPTTSASASCSTASGGGSSCTTDTQSVSSPLGAYTAVLKQITDLGLFVKGTSLANIEGGIELRVESASTATLLLGELQTLLGGLSSSKITIGSLNEPGTDGGFTVTVPSIPLPIDVASKGDLIVAAIGTGALTDALSTSGRLGDSLTGPLLGPDVHPLLGLSLSTVATLLKSFGLNSDATVAKILPYLDSLGTLAVGQSQSGGYTVERIAVG
jgi:hypothetical protein